ncbi:MAG: hypothetical protein WCF20_01155 [Methylovirgula sp.]
MRPDSHIKDVLHTLSDPEEYVRGILAIFLARKFNRDEATIRVGVSGTGVFPNYCIEEGFIAITLPSLDRPISCYRRRTVFSGRNHREILEDQFKGESWSLTAMNFIEVQAILGQLRDDRKLH